MKTKLIVLFVVMTGGLFLTGNAWARGYYQAPPPPPPEYDYSDAPGYDAAWHSNPSWQRLGTVWTDETAPRVPEDNSDDGVSWSVDNGATYGHDDILAGQTVTFKFDIYKQEWGRHATEQLAVWLDWNQDADFSDDGERIFLNAWDFRADYPSSPYDDSFADVSESFFFDLVFPEEALGDYWLRARVACNFDVNPVENFTPTGHVWQGEVEDWMLTVNPIPEPSTILLLGGGLAGLAFAVRRRRQK